MNKNAKLVRMVTTNHLCPWGIKAKDILKRKGYEIEDNHLESMEANKTYKEENNFDETPQIFIEGKHIGNYEDLRKHFGMKPEEKDGKTYQPIIAIFCVCFLMAVTTSYTMTAGLPTILTLELFIAFSMCVLGIQKLQNLSTFTSGFVQYDLLAQKDVRYGYIYPFVETSAGILMITGLFTWVVAPVVLFVSSIGAISIIKAVYIDKKDLECACTGGGDRVPLGAISLTENLMMILMAAWMILKQTGLILL